MGRNREESIIGAGSWWLPRPSSPSYACRGGPAKPVRSLQEKDLYLIRHTIEDYLKLKEIYRPCFSPGKIAVEPGRRHKELGDKGYAGSNMSLGAPQSGQTQSAGRFSKAVPDGMLFQDRPFPDRRCSHKSCICTVSSLPPVFGIAIDSSKRIAL